MFQSLECNCVIAGDDVPDCILSPPIRWQLRFFLPALLRCVFWSHSASVGQMVWAHRAHRERNAREYGDDFGAQVCLGKFQRTQLQFVIDSTHILWLIEVYMYTNLIQTSINHMSMTSERLIHICLNCDSFFCPPGAQVGLKSDVRGAESTQCVSAESSQEFADAIGAEFHTECSSKTGVCVGGGHVCVSACERECVCVCVWVSACVSEWVSVCVCVCVCEREWVS